MQAKEPQPLWSHRPKSMGLKHLTSEALQIILLEPSIFLNGMDQTPSMDQNNALSAKAPGTRSYMDLGMMDLVL